MTVDWWFVIGFGVGACVGGVLGYLRWQRWMVKRHADRMFRTIESRTPVASARWRREWGQTKKWIDGSVSQTHPNG